MRFLRLAYGKEADWLALLASSPEPPRPWADLTHETPNPRLAPEPDSTLEGAAGLAMAFKLIESAQDRWRAVNAPTLSP